ncbi:MAG: hypothetical protein PHP12_05840 [Bacilli bacterium]|nr:hypothetical protein [Bacilli bacterium]
MNEVTVQFLYNNNYVDSIQAILNLLLILLIAIFSISFFKKIYRYFKYGYIEYNKHPSLKHKKDLILFMIGKIPGYRKIISPKGLNSDFIIFDQSGIYLLKIFDYEGMVSGKVNNKKVVLQRSSNNEELIDNPYLELVEDEKKILINDKKAKIKKYIIISSMCVFNMDRDKEVNVISLGKIDSAFKKAAFKQVYTKEDIKKYYKEFR